MTQHTDNWGFADGTGHNFVSINSPLWKKAVANCLSQDGDDFCEVDLSTEEGTSRNS